MGESVLVTDSLLSCSLFLWLKNRVGSPYSRPSGFRVLVCPLPFFTAIAAWILPRLVASMLIASMLVASLEAWFRGCQTKRKERLPWAVLGVR